VFPQRQGNPLLQEQSSDPSWCIVPYHDAAARQNHAVIVDPLPWDVRAALRITYPQIVRPRCDPPPMVLWP
jgi:hypothetical protein